MATITVDTFLDDAARTAGEGFTINGCTLTIRTDTRVHANAPAGMLGSLSAVNVSGALGGGIVVDGTKVRWMPFDTGSGNVPAVGTIVTQGGVSGYLLGVWADYTSAPVVPGNPFPALGFLKFREVTGGAFSAGALTGISASAVSPDVTGWIEIAMDASSTFTAYDIGSGIAFNGAWFELGTTSGTRGQTLNVPTNGGGAETHVFGVQIETSPGSNVFEWFPTAHATLNGAIWATANLATDARAKFVEDLGDGAIRIGSNAAGTSIGYLPQSGCKVRIPNIFGRTVAAASRNVNQRPGAVTRARISSPQLTIDGLHCDFSVLAQSCNTKTSLKKFVCEQPFTLKYNNDQLVIDDIAIGGYTLTAATVLTLTGINNAAISKLKVVSALPSYSQTVHLDKVFNATFSDYEVISAKAKTSLTYNTRVYSSGNITFTNTKSKGGVGYWLVSNTNLTFTNTDYIDRVEGNTTSNSAANVFSLYANTDLVIDGVTFGENGAIAETQCYDYIVASGANPNTNIKTRNFGTRAAPLNCGSSAALYPAGAYSLQNGDTNIKIQRVYLTGTRNETVSSYAQSNMLGLLIEDVYSIWTKKVVSTPYGYNAVIRKCGSPVNATTAPGNFGTHWVDFFSSDTEGTIVWMPEKPTQETISTTYLVAAEASGTGWIPGTPALSLDTQGDYCISEMQWVLKGHTGFRNLAPSTSGATGIVIYFQIDNGSGYSGTWVEATAANLFAASLNPAGAKLKIKILQTQAASTSTTNAYIIFYTTSTFSAQADNLYPLDTVTLSFEGLKAGSEVRAYVGTDPATAVEIGGTESSGTTFSFQHSSSGQDGYIAIFAMGYNPIFLPRTYAYTDSTLLIQQVVDRNYSNPA